MPWCPKCRTEYREGFKVCSECEIDLIDELEPEESEEIIEQDREVYLISAGNNIEAEILESLLNSNGIPVLKKYKEAGAYLEICMGATNLGVDLYVPSKLLIKAKEVIESNQKTIADSAFEEEKEDEKGLDQKYNKKRRIRTWIALLFFIPGLLFIIIGVLYSLYNYFIR